MYNAEISRRSPALVVVLLDQSGSMRDHFGGDHKAKSKADGLADTMNALFHNMVLKATKGEKVNDYIYVSVIGYGCQVGPCLSGSLAGKHLIPVSDLANNPFRIDDRTRKVSDGAGGLIEQKFKMPIWLDPVAENGTPMANAFDLANDVIKTWLMDHPGGFPPILINVSDGAPNLGQNPEVIAQSIMQLSTTDGNVLVFNVHLSETKANSIEFPNTDANLPDEHAKLLFRISSELPAPMMAAARNEGYTVTEGSRGFIMNADQVGLIQFLDIGTRVAVHND